MTAGCGDSGDSGNSGPGSGNSAGTGITVSVGYAALGSDEFISHDKLFDAADAALYSAKESGRNRIAGYPGRRGDDAPPAAQPSA